MSDTLLLEDVLVQQAADGHAADARLLESMAAFHASGEWQGHGIRSFGHWCDINLGISSGRAHRLASAAERLAGLPVLAAAFADGTVSLDKVLLVAPVASAASDTKLTAIAVAASVAQLARICAELRKLNPDNSPEARARREMKRGLSWSREDDLVKIVAWLEPDEAAIVQAAIDARVEDDFRRDRESEDPAPRRELSVRRADALVEAMTDAVVSGPDPVVLGERIEIRVNVDAALLTGERHDGICELDGFGSISLSLAHRLTCDASIRLAGEIDGIFQLGRKQRTPNRQQRRALARRDRGCRYPGCPMRRYVQAHHVLPWEWDGPTDMDNLVLLCRHHHKLFHEGGYQITAVGDGQFEFCTPDGRPIARPPSRARPGSPPPAPGSPRATDGGERFDLDLTIDALTHDERRRN